MQQQEIREQLSSDMKQFLVDTQWDQYVKDSTQEIMEFRTDRPLLYLYEKLTVQQKLDSNNKVGLMIFDVAASITKLDPVVHTKDQIFSSILKLMIDKYQIIRLKKFEVFKCILLMLLESPISKEMKEFVIKQFNDKIDENTNSNQFSRIVYTILYFYKLVNEIHQLSEQMELRGKKKLQLQDLIWYIEEDEDQEQTLMAQVDMIKVLQGGYGKLKTEQFVNVSNMTPQIIQMLIQTHFEN